MMWLRLYKTTILVLFVISMYPWFLWNISPILICFVGAVSSILFYIFNRKYFSLERRYLLPNILLLISFVFYAKGFTFLGFIEQILVFLNIFILLNLKKDIKKIVFDFLTKGIAIIIGVSLIYYVVHLLGVHLPYTPISMSELGYTGDNYYLFVESPHLGNFCRFRSIFAEPGHLTMGLIPILFANRFNLKNRYVFILLIAQLFTLSLAGYIALFIGLLFYSFSNSINKKYPRTILISLFFVSIFFIGKISIDNPFYLLIIARLEYDDSKGNIAGYNRTDEYGDYVYNSFVSSPMLLWGEGANLNNIVEGVAGYKVYLIRFGLLSVLFVLMFYLSICYSHRQYDVIAFFILLLFMLYQNAYPFWFCFVFGYILGVSELYNLGASIKK